MNEDQPGVSLHIERLVLDGVPLSAGSVGELQTAMQSELTRLLTENGLAHAAQGAMHFISAPSIQVASDSVPADLGKQIARSVYQSFTATHE